jgi:hypothetical protein
MPTSSSPRRVYLDSQERVSLSWEARALDGLELPSVVLTVVHRLNFNFSLSSSSEDKKIGETVG